MNNDLISREALKKQIKNDYCKNHCPLPDAEYYCPSNCSARYFIKLIDNAPTVEYTFEEAFQKTVCEQRLYCPAKPQGEWTTGYSAKQKKVAVCNLCNCISFQGKTNFCPNCGADMRKGGAV